MALMKSHLKNLFYVIHKRATLKANYGSSLFISGDKATDVCVVVSPHIDFEDKLKNIDSVRENVKKRNMNIDVDSLKDVWKFYIDIRNKKEALEEKKLSYGDRVKEIRARSDENMTTELEKCKIENKMIREDLKNLKPSLWAIEENAMIRALALPNMIHPRTPEHNFNEISAFKEKPVTNVCESHVNIATDRNLLHFETPQNYYLKNDAAIFELCSQYYFSGYLRNEGFVQFSNSDFVKSVAVEGCGLDPKDPESVYTLKHTEDSKFSEDLRIHLVGGASLASFIAFHARNITLPKMLPLRYFTLGRQYKPVSQDTKDGLFNVSQSSCVELFVVVKDSTENLDVEIDKTVDLVTDIYKSIGYHFRVCYQPVQMLAPWESLRVSFQMFSTSQNAYVEVGNLSVSDNYICKRLQFCYKENGVTKYPKLVSGTILNVPKLLGCVLEQNPEETFQIPTIIRNAL